MKKLILSLILTILLTAYPVWAFGDLTALDKPGLKKPPEISGSIVEDSENTEDGNAASGDDAKEVPGDDIMKPGLKKPSTPDEDKNGKDKNDKDKNGKDKKDENGKDTKELEASGEDKDQQAPGGEGNEGMDKPEGNPADPGEESAEAFDKEGSGLSENDLTEHAEEKEEEIKIPATVSVNTQEPDIVKKDEPGKDAKWWEDNEYLILLSSGVVITLLLLLLLVHHIRQRKRSTYTSRDPRTNPPGDEVIRREAIRKPAAGDVELDITMVEGSLKRGKGTFYMHRDIIIGSDESQCEIAIDGTDVSARHARISISEGHLFIEDLNSQGGTFVGGMRIYTANRLRNGDEIGIGDGGFVIHFKNV